MTRLFKYYHVDTSGGLKTEMDTRDHRVEVDVINKMDIIRDHVDYYLKHKSELNSSIYESSPFSSSASTFALEGGPTN